MKKFILIGLIGCILIWGSYQAMFSDNEDVTAVQDETEPQHITQNIETLINEAIEHYNRLLKQHETLEIDHETVRISDSNIKNWIIHTHIQSAVLANENLEGIELVDRALQYKHTNEAIIKWAKEVHDTEVTDKEIKDYIKQQLAHIENGEQAHPFFVKISEALELTEAEYFYEWEYDRFAQLLIQDKLYDIYQENYSQFEDEPLEEYQGRLIALMEKDLNEYRNH
ncbi:hypothetical protein [Tenuibacillus multivorans]|uniref:Uncharacterized protein n=1 Tax=Tenuibacillus multivorans TaxID=237069 RepID=A0A1H0AZJ3_9BACI|nr:hypothetical protein [Tenuibacillus multivorans]GEL77604.1 hypothetical protein TMU01_18390 [Tenuibacillus multivorans]SDN38666.1 hypothetical protein SAMN05216498_2144 [Tenuibacillus multivorans]